MNAPTYGRRSAVDLSPTAPLSDLPDYYDTDQVATRPQRLPAYVYRRRRIAAVLALVASVAAGERVVSYVEQPDCRFSTATHELTIDGGLGWEYAARQIPGVNAAGEECLDEAEALLHQVNADIPLTLSGEIPAGASIQIPDEAHAKGILDLIGL